MIRKAVRFLDQRSGAAPLLRKTLRYAFPDHWSFLLGEVALYAFIVLVATGVYLTFFFEPSTAKATYEGSYAPLHGLEASKAYISVLHISFDVKAGLLIRQTHHWAADVFLAAIVLHLIRVFFTGAYRKPRELTYVIGVLMLFAALLEGYLGYSLVDDLLSGMGLAIGYGVALSIPFVGANLALAIWGHPFPGAPEFWSRMYIAHVLILPLLIGGLLSAHLALVASRHHTQFKRKRAPGERRLLGLPAFPAQAPRSLGLLFAVAAALVLLGGLVQINPVWLWGPYHVSQGTNGAQPDWYLGWLIGALRLVPHFDVVVWNRTLVPEPLLGRHPLPHGGHGGAARLALGGAAGDRRPALPQRAPAAARGAAADGDRRRLPQLGGDDLPRRRLGPDARLAGDQLHEPGLVLPRGGLDPALRHRLPRLAHLPRTQGDGGGGGGAGERRAGDRRR